MRKLVTCPRISLWRTPLEDAKLPAVKRVPIRRNKPMPNRTSPVKARNAKRAKANLERAHGSADRREWITTLPCYNCGIIGYSQGAHINNGGTSREPPDSSCDVPNTTQPSQFQVSGEADRTSRIAAPLVVAVEPE